MKRKSEPVDEFAETQVLLGPRERTAERVLLGPSEHAAERDSDALSLYAEYERELARESSPRRTKHSGR